MIGQRWRAAALVTLGLVAPARAEGPLEKVQAIALNGPPGKLDHLALDAKRGRLFVANTAHDTLDVVDLKSGKLVAQVALQRGVQGVAYAADLDRVFTGNHAGGTVGFIGGETYALQRRLPLGGDADNVRYDPRTGLVYVAHNDSDLTIIDGRAVLRRGAIDLPGGALGAFQLESGRPRLYADVKGSGEVAVVDTKAAKVVKRIKLGRAGENAALAIDEADHLLFVGCRKPAKLVVVDSESGDEVADLPIADDVDDVWYDAKRKHIYMSCGGGALVVARQAARDSYEEVARVETPKGARTSLFDPESGRLFLVVPRQGTMSAPEVWVYRLK
ncbi:MAG TPA: hypothetical protein VG406_17415 [Isosphaeraceae bacterium]|jgi:hypothetical protein|nr:hypothetical protein [Isosphaeraceae bacterium]